MLKNYFRIAWRNLWKNKTFTILNLGGLTISLAACIVIYFWASDELNYDTAGSNADRVFRVALTLKVKDQPDKDFAVTASQLAPVLVKDFPEIEKSVRILPSKVLISQNEKNFYTSKFFYADLDFFDVFGYSLVKGDPHTALHGTRSAVISESMAKKCFGDEDPIGKTITCNDTTLLKVTGVAKDLSAKNHFQFDIICSFKYLELTAGGPDNLGGWWDDSYYTYVLLKDARSSVALNSKIANIIDKYNHEQNVKFGLFGTHYLQSLRDIHLHSNLRAEINPNGSLSSFRIFIGIAIFLLVVACINYVNLSTATALKRAKEIGMRKVVGAAFSQLVGQFLSESILISLIALAFSIGLAQLLLPGFNSLAQTQISFGAHMSLKFLAIIFSSSILLGLVAGLYPAIFLSRVKPINVFKNSIEKKASLLPFRKVLVIFQFTLSILLIIATTIAVQQLHYMQSQDVGLNKEQVVAVPLQNYSDRLLEERLKAAFEGKPGVLSVSSSSATPGKRLANITVLPEGVPQDKTQTMGTLVVDYDFFKTYKLSMVSGRTFSKDFGGDSSAFILNETAVKDLGWTNKNAVGKNFKWGYGKEGKIIGVAKDFHFNSLQSKITSTVIHILPVNSGWYRFLSVKANSSNMKQVLVSLESGWKEVLADHPFEYFFVDEDYDKQYGAEQRLSSLSVIFSILTILISCLGLFGLVLIAVARRTKEIGIRKVLGASIAGITTLVSKDFLQLVCISILIATPLGWWLMHEWLNDFPYHVQMSWLVFFAAGLLAIFIALMTISFHAIGAALTNPVKSLRTE